jgi:putative nucleotidyltransferase with HDIG domain
MKNSRNGPIKEIPSKKTIKRLLKGFDRGSTLSILLVLTFGLLSSLIVGKELSIHQIFGGFLITGLLLLIFYRDIFRYKPDYIKKYRMLLLLGLLIIFTLALSRGFQFLFQNFALGKGLFHPETAIYIMPVPAGAILVTLIFDFHTAIIFSFIVSLLTGLWVGEPLFPIYAFVGSLVGAFSVIRCKNRKDILRSGIYVSTINIFTLFGILLFKGTLIGQGESNGTALISIIFAALSGIVVSMVVSIVLPAIESIFKVTTDITLLEILDLNHPIMKSLMINAPGTYHHSIIVGNLVESVAEDIGVNPLLARVSAYYHDIGKMKMPDYFIENQRGAVSKHDKLTPHMSSMILMAHVKEGIEIAKKYKLPEPVIDVLEQHHGTCLKTYFYQKAKESGDGEPDEADYRYQGPKPKTRVAALVMLADAVEAASRVLKDPTPARIESLVDKVINHIFLDRQLEDCEITLKDISIIKKKFTYILTGILHKRVEYPGFEFNRMETQNTALETESTTEQIQP